MRLFWILGALALALLPLQIQAQAGWEIEEFLSDIAVQVDGSVRVQETIKVDFASLEKHGIFRDLPVVYQQESGDRIYSQISEVEVQQDGKQAKVEITRNDSNMRIRIGDADRTISGKHEYIISYRVLGVLQAFEGFDELNWNVTGNDWEAPIEKAVATVRIPAPILQIACYEGVVGATDACQEAKQEDTIVRFASESLSPGEGLTVAVGYTLGVVPVIRVDAPPSPLDVIFSSRTLGAAMVVFFSGIVWIIQRWWKFGRDRYWQRAHLPGERSDREGKDVPEKILPLFFKRPISVEYDPPDDLRPAEIGVLMDEQADTLDVSATIVDLAAHGYLTITDIPKKWMFGKSDYELSRTDKDVAKLLKYEQELLERLFDSGDKVKLSELKNSFYKDLAKVKELLYEEVVNKGLFPAAPHKTRQVAIAKGIGLLVLGGLLWWAALGWLTSSGIVHVGQQLLFGFGVGLEGVGIISLLFSRAMPRKTGYGRELYQRVLGYELFISRTEKYRARFLEDDGLFEKVLPYAVMFGVTDKLARAFKDMGVTPPQPAWYNSATAFDATAFASSMDSFSTSLSSAMASSPSSSGSGGGGSSGGGFGGGGGGSW